MEGPRRTGQPLSQRRARSLDRLQNPRKVSESWDSQSLSLPANPSSRGPPERTSHEGRKRPQSPGPPEAPGSTGTALLEGTREFVPCEQRPPQDTKKDKAQGWAQQGWLKTALNFLLRMGPEEPREKAGRRARGKEGLPQPAETSESPGAVPAPRKKAHDKKANRKKHGHKKHVDEEARGSQDQEAEGQEVAVPKTAAVTCSEEADPGPGPRGGEDSDLHQPLPVEGRDAGISEPSPEASGPRQEEELTKLDQDTIIQMIVQVLRKMGDRLEEERLQAFQPKKAPQNTGPVLRKKSQEKKSPVKRTFSHKKHGSEEPKRGAAVDVSGPESRPSKRPSFLYLCVGGHRPSISSSLGLEEPEVQEALSTDGGGPRPSECSSQAGSRGPGEDSQPDSTSECREFIQKIIALLQDEEEQEAEQDVQGPELPAENPAPPCRKKSQEKKSSFRKAFSHKRHGSKEPKRAGAVGAVGAASPEFRSPRRPSYLPLCMGGHRPSISSSVDVEGPELQESPPAEGGRVASCEAPSQARSHKPEGRSLSDGALEPKELIIQKLVALLQKADGHLGEQIRRHPSFKRFFYQLPDSSLRKLAAILRRQAACSPDPDRNLAERPCPFAFGLANTSRSYHAVLRLMGLRYPHLSYMGAPQSITSPETQSPD
ncbi:protein BNIP5 isoform X2 [Saccopteryx bilineata]